METATLETATLYHASYTRPIAVDLIKRHAAELTAVALAAGNAKDATLIEHYAARLINAIEGDAR